MEYKPGKHQLTRLTLHLGLVFARIGLKGSGHGFFSDALQVFGVVKRSFVGTTLTSKEALKSQC